MFSGGLISGPMMDRYGPKVRCCNALWKNRGTFFQELTPLQVILVPCSTLFILSVMLSSLCKEYYQFILAQGILGGLTNGLCYTPSLTAVNHYFFKRRPLAMGIASSGSSLAGVIFPIALSRMLNDTSLGFGWSVRILGFIMLVFAIISCITINTNAPKRKTGSPFVLDAWKHPAYTIQVIGLFLVIMCFFVPSFYIPSYAQSIGISVNLSNYLIAIFNAASFFGRILGGAFANRLGRFNTLIASSAVCGVLSLAWLAIDAHGSMIVFSALFGFFSGIFIGLFTATIALTAPRPNVIGSYIGMALGVLSLASLIGTPITGAMISHYHSFHQAMIFAGVCGLVGAGLIIKARVHYSKEWIA